MRLTLYDAAFASLVRVGGHHARRPIAQITLLGGLASTVFWPLGHALVHYFDWRGALWAYAGFALLTLPLHLAIPPSRHEAPPPAAGAVSEQPPLAVGRPDTALSRTFYVLILLVAALHRVV